MSPSKNTSHHECQVYLLDSLWKWNDTNVGLIYSDAQEANLQQGQSKNSLDSVIISLGGCLGHCTINQALASFWLPPNTRCHPQERGTGGWYWVLRLTRLVPGGADIPRSNICFAGLSSLPGAWGVPNRVTLTGSSVTAAQVSIRACLHPHTLKWLCIKSHEVGETYL